ncbi:MAG: hypothetical protein K2X77_20740 [Candidatus Obscuribacterales bacterium]|jgi:hypothetical protein|nr:hypothetical protein [Candidatus Obscuribacterales bacterium]
MNSLPSVKMDENYRGRLKEFHTKDDIPAEWRDTPIEAFILSQNFGWPVQPSGHPELLISTCIEFRYALPIPRMYAYVIRRASGRVIGSEFSVGYTLSKGVRNLVLIGHNDCGMCKMSENAPGVVAAFVEQGWSKEAAEAYVQKHGTRHAIEDELDSLKDEFMRLKTLFPKINIAPLFVCLHDSRLYLPEWYSKDLGCEPAYNHVSDQLIASLP